jgi:hypothetical protein
MTIVNMGKTWPLFQTHHDTRGIFESHSWDKQRKQKKSQVWLLKNKLISRSGFHDYEYERHLTPQITWYKYVNKCREKQKLQQCYSNMLSSPEKAYYQINILAINTFTVQHHINCIQSLPQITGTDINKRLYTDKSTISTTSTVQEVRLRIIKNSRCTRRCVRYSCSTVQTSKSHMYKIQ